MVVTNHFMTVGLSPTIFLNRLKSLYFNKNSAVSEGIKSTKLIFCDPSPGFEMIFWISSRFMTSASNFRFCYYRKNVSKNNADMEQINLSLT